MFTNQIAEHPLGLSAHFRCEMFTFGVGPRPLTLPYANSTSWSGLRVVYCVQWWNVYHFQPTHSRTGTPRHTQTRTHKPSHLGADCLARCTPAHTHAHRPVTETVPHKAYLNIHTQETWLQRHRPTLRTPSCVYILHSPCVVLSTVQKMVRLAVSFR